MPTARAFSGQQAVYKLTTNDLLCATPSCLLDQGGYSVNLSPKRNNSKQKKQQQKRNKSTARDLLKAVASLAIGDNMADLAYGVGAKVVRRAKNSKKKRSSTISESRVHRTGVFYSSVSNGSMKLSTATSRYLRAFLDPFASDVKLVGAPRAGAMPSYKATGFIRGVGYIGSLGMGYVIFSPTLCNNVACVGYTTSSYGYSVVSSFASDDNTTTPVGSVTAPAGASMGNLPYSWTTLATPATIRDTIEGRVVSSSLRVYYTGTQLNSSGQYYGYVDPDFTSVVSSPHNLVTAPADGYTVSMLGQKEATEIAAIHQNEMRLVMVPPVDTMCDYPLQGASALRKTFPYSQNVVNGFLASGAPPAVIVVTGVPGQSFYFEAITHVEYVGPGVMQGLLSESATDAVGYDAVNTVLQRAVRRTAADARCSFNKCLKDELRADRISM